MKGIDALIRPVALVHQNNYEQTAYPYFNDQTMTKQTSLIGTIRQFPHELLSLLGNTNISDADGRLIMPYIQQLQFFFHLLQNHEFSIMLLSLPNFQKYNTQP